MRIVIQYNTSYYVSVSIIIIGQINNYMEMRFIM